MFIDIKNCFAPFCVRGGAVLIVLQGMGQFSRGMVKLGAGRV
jgi:hypothetical protein